MAIQTIALGDIKVNLFFRMLKLSRKLCGYYLVIYILYEDTPKADKRLC